MFIFRHVQYLLFGVQCLLARGPPPGGQRPDQRPPPDQRPSSSLEHYPTIIYSEQSPDLRPSPSLQHSKFTINSERTLNPRPSSNLDHSKSTINSEQSHIQRLSSSLEHSKITMTSEKPHNLKPSYIFEHSEFAMNSEQSHNLKPSSSFEQSKFVMNSEQSHNLRPSSSFEQSKFAMTSEQSHNLRPSSSFEQSKFAMTSEQSNNLRPSSSFEHSKFAMTSEQSNNLRPSSSFEHSKFAMTSEQSNNLRPSSSFEHSKFAMNSEQSHNLRPSSSYKSSKSMTKSEYMNNAAMTSAGIPSITAHIHRPPHSSISMYSKVQSSRSQLLSVITTYSQWKCGSNLYMTDDSSTGIHFISSMEHLVYTSMLQSTPSTDFHNHKSNSECSQDCQAKRQTTTIYSRLRSSGDQHASYHTFRPSPTINRLPPIYGTETGQSPLTDSISPSRTKIPFKSDIFLTRMMTTSIHETATQNHLTEIMTSITSLKPTPVNPSKEMTSRKQSTDVSKSSVGLDLGHEDSKEMDNGKPVSTAGSFFTAGILVLVNRLV